MPIGTSDGAYHESEMDFAVNNTLEPMMPGEQYDDGPTQYSKIQKIAEGDIPAYDRLKSAEIGMEDQLNSQDWTSQEKQDRTKDPFSLKVGDTLRSEDVQHLQKYLDFSRIQKDMAANKTQDPFGNTVKGKDQDRVVSKPIPQFRPDTFASKI